uniref:Reverse transcriptase domain-containing protein n=1 Tax=Tanacetum cinerariifolium TaxID=118510 RepID=A0A6L2MT97_TANCI|nr:hypothetical protein [Tanacetum cinerariifolium]
MTPIVEYLKEGTLPSDKKEARKLRIKARQYELLEGILYRRSVPYAVVKMCWTAPSGGCDNRNSQGDECDMIRKCNDCQIHRPITRNRQQPLTPITAPLMFYKYGIDIAGPFSKGPGKVKFLIVAMDYFTKWIEAKEVAIITSAVIPTKIRMPTYRTTIVDVVYNNKELRLNLDLLEERRERTAIRKAKAKLKMTKHYNAWVRYVTFRPGDFVYCSNDDSHTVAGGKLGPK